MALLYRWFMFAWCVIWWYAVTSLWLKMLISGWYDLVCLLSQVFSILHWMGMRWRPLNWQKNLHLNYLIEIRTCILISWAFILLSLSVLGNGEHSKNNSSNWWVSHLSLLNLHFFGSTEALEFAQTKLTPFGMVQKYVEKLEVCIHLKEILFSTFWLIVVDLCLTFIWHERALLWLQDFMALLAYEEPEKSPMFHLLSLDYRQHVADSLNRAILGAFLLISSGF